MQVIELDSEVSPPAFGLSGDERLVFEGGPVPVLEDAMLGDASDAAAEEGDAAQSTNIDRRRRLEQIVNRRRRAIASARAERKVLEARIAGLDRQIVSELRPALERAKRQGNRDKMRRLDDRIHRLDLNRGIVAARAIRYAKTEGLGQVLIRNARTQQQLLTLIQQAQRTGKTSAASTLQRAFNQIAGKTQRYKRLRRHQVHDWREKTAGSRIALARMLREQAQERLARLEDAAGRGSIGQRITRQAAEHRVLVTKLKAAEERERSRLQHLAVRDAQGMASMPFSEATALAATMELEGFEGIWSSIKRYAKKTGGAITAPGRAVGGAVKDAVRQVGSAAKRLAKGAACAAASNPAVLAAAGSAAGTVLGGPAGTIAGGLAAKAAGGLLSAACPQRSNAPGPQPTSGTAAMPVSMQTAASGMLQPQPRSMTPILIGGGLATAGILAAVALSANRQDS